MSYDFQAERSQPREEPRTSFTEDVEYLWNGIFSPSKKTKSPETRDSYGNRSSPSRRDSYDNRSPSRRDSYDNRSPSQFQAPPSPTYEDTGREYARYPPSTEFSSPGSRRLSPQHNVEYLEPRYVEGRRVDYDPRYDEYTPHRRSTPLERREVEPHEVRVLGQQFLESQPHQQVHSVQRVAVPTSRSEYRALDQERVPTAVRPMQSSPTGRPRSNSPQRFGRHDHTLYSKNSTNYSPVTQIEVSKSDYQPTQTANYPPPQYTTVRTAPIVRHSPPEVAERIVIVEKPVCCTVSERLKKFSIMFEHACMHTPSTHTYMHASRNST